MSLRHYWANDNSPNKALQPTPGDRRGRSEAQGRARLTLSRYAASASFSRCYGTDHTEGL
jgi:hypothetical protein